jgi:glycerol-3-phosphate dehydrogenase (NAD(P)+)
VKIAASEPPAPPVTILGAGPFGKALGQVAARRGARVTVWTRRPQGDLPPELHLAPTLAEAARAARLFFFCAPAAHARPLLRALGDVVDGGHLLVHAARGLEPSDAGGLPVSEIVRQETPIRRIGVLAGPLVPHELEAAIPSAIVVASRFPEVTAAAQQALAQDALRVYGSDDLLGVELAAALMTVVSLAAGLAAGLGGGVSTRALVVARGIAQSARILEAFGAKARTLSGLGGVGEVFVTAQGVESPDYDLGIAIARGTHAETLGVALARGAEADALRSTLGRTCEGPSVAKCVARLCAAKGLKAPLFSAIAEIVSGKRPDREELRTLLGGSAASEL